MIDRRPLPRCCCYMRRDDGSHTRECCFAYASSGVCPMWTDEDEARWADECVLDMSADGPTERLFRFIGDIGAVHCGKLPEMPRETLEQIAAAAMVEVAAARLHKRRYGDGQRRWRNHAKWCDAHMGVMRIVGAATK